MSPLRERQTRFREALLGGDVTPALETIAPDGLTAAGRLAVYRHHVIVTLTDALRAAYPVVCRLVGDGFFAYAADRFIAAFPPASPCLFEYGGALPAFLASFEPCRSLAYLPDVARLEWAMSQAASSDDAPPLDARALTRIPVAALERVRFTFHPSVTLLESPWPIDRIWRANQPDADPDLIVDLGAGGVQLEVRRVAEDVVFHALEPGVHALRSALQAGRTLGAATADALARQPDLDLTAALTDLFHDETLTAYDTEDHPCRPCR